MLVVMENYVESWHAAVLAKGTDTPQDDKETEEDKEQGGNHTCKSMCALANVHETSANMNTVLTYYI
jgi:hypothetical protein